ncbi:MAG TPA: Asp-tRNA(Asn)/Glu-tRNA(Gln) amidotransferase subunit GatB [Thermotogota bacterium]|nr:Asp-tRNA(Asn)/Glu-tRNA(Gln) amidotransferase subunit GatB [Thermotogota bacterium]HQN20850.1 Asp-tRNA(Asn)/Glu-tRNA(Gln) amidotransferase subunit GatB [Thermotogota bacterium]
MSIKPQIGLEIHAQLLTNTKAFCGCSSESFETPPNTHICEVCTGQPGALPTLNGVIVAFAVKAALALNCQINERSVFDRKNYFYPDLSKGFQITQYFHPIAENGSLLIHTDGRKKRVRIRRVHIEEDAGKLIHHSTTLPGGTYVDYNRCGIALLEVVTEPDLDTSQEAHAFMETLRNTFRTLGICSGDMEKGALRCDANISVRDTERGTSTARIEIKNVNSFKFVQKALEYEFERLKTALMSGEKTVSETRGWDQVSRSTVSLRNKEDDNDYRYFPEPDLPDIVLERTWIERIRSELPELPVDKQDRLMEQYGLTFSESKTYLDEPELETFFVEAVGQGLPVKSVNNWLLGEIQKMLKERGVTIDQTALTVSRLAEIIEWVSTGKTTNHIVKTLMPDLLDKGVALSQILSERGISQINDRAYVTEISSRVVRRNPEQAEAYLFGKTGLLKYFIGLVMKETKGQCDPYLVQEILKELLEGKNDDG